MNDHWILNSKLTPPSRPGDWIERELLPPGRRLPPMAALLAGPGDGKTLGLLALASPEIAAGAVLLWYGLDPYDADPASFFLYLVAGVRATIPQFGRDIEAMIASGVSAPKPLWQGFFGALAAYNLPGLVLAIDDLHHLDGPGDELVRALLYFADKLPPRVHVLVSSRKRLPLPLSRLQAQGAIAVVEAERLRFSSDEEARFLARRAGGGPIPAAWQSLAVSLEGWPLGLDLATSLGADAAPDLTAEGRSLLAGYVAEELLGVQPADRRAFMVKASLLQELTPAICQDVLGLPRAAQTLEALAADQLLRPLEDGAGYRFPAYLRDHLNAEARRALDPAERAELDRRAAAFFRAAGQDELAIAHLLGCANWAAAIALCESSFPAMRFSGRQAQITRLLEAFPTSAAAGEPAWQLWRGHDRSRTGQSDEALACYDRARGLYHARGDRAGEFKVVVRQASLALIRQELALADQRLAEAEALRPDGRDEDLADLWLARSLAAEQTGDMARMRACNEAVLAVPIANNIEIAASHCIAGMNQTTAALHQGDLAEARRHVARAIEVASAWRFHPYHLFASFLQAHLRLCEGDVEGASPFFRTLSPDWEAWLNWHNLGCALVILAHYHQLKEDWKAAEDALRRSLAIFDQAGFKEGRKVPLERLAWVALQRGQFGRVGALLADVDGAAGTSLYDLAPRVPLVRALHLGGDPAAALALAESLVPALDRLEAHLLSAQAGLFQAAARVALGDATGARADLRRVMALVEARGYDFLLGRDRALWESLEPLVAPGPAGRAAGVRSSSVPALELHCFGGFELRLGGMLLDRWPRRKAKLVVAALALYPAGLRLEELAGLLGLEDLTPAALNTLQCDVSALRRQLEPQLAKGQASSYVRLHDERYVLSPDLIAALDVSAFERALTEAERLRDVSPVLAAERYAEGLNHFRGNLLADGLFARYFEAEREHYRQKALGAIQWMVAFHRDRGDHTQAERMLARAVEVAPCEAEVYLAFMRHCLLRGRADRVRQLYWDYRKALKAQLGLAPEQAFEAAYRELVGDPTARIAPRLQTS